MLSTRAGMNSLLPTFGPMRREFQRAVDEVGHGRRALQVLCPISMWQDDQHVYVQAEVPGVSHDGLDLQFEDGKLWIRGERKWSDDKMEFEYNERSFGKFERAILLSDVIDPTSIDASLEHGVLSITLMKKPESQPRTIQVKDRATPVKKSADESSSDCCPGAAG